MSFDDREWRREEIRQQRDSQRQQTHRQHASNMSVDQFLASQRKQQAYPVKTSTNKNLSKAFALLFLLICLGSAVFLLYQWYL